MLVIIYCVIFFFNDTATTEIYTLSLHDALPISSAVTIAHVRTSSGKPPSQMCARPDRTKIGTIDRTIAVTSKRRSEEHTSELQSRQYLVCRLLLEKKKKDKRIKYLHCVSI